jgi:two-component system response regulator FixJ
MGRSGHACVYAIDDDEDFLRSLVGLLLANGFAASGVESGGRFLDELDGLEPGIIMLDVRMPGMDGLSFLEALRNRAVPWPVVMMTGHGDIPLAVRCIQAGAIEFIQKPFDEDTLHRGLSEAAQVLSRQNEGRAHAAFEQRRLDALSKREREVLAALAKGHTNKQIAHDLDLSVRTVEMHRSNLMRRLGVRTMPEVIRIGMRLGF